MKTVFVAVGVVCILYCDPDWNIWIFINTRIFSVCRAIGCVDVFSISWVPFHHHGAFYAALGPITSAEWDTTRETKWLRSEAEGWHLAQGETLCRGTKLSNWNSSFPPLSTLTYLTLMMIFQLWEGNVRDVQRVKLHRGSTRLMDAKHGSHASETREWHQPSPSHGYRRFEVTVWQQRIFSWAVERCTCIWEPQPNVTGYSVNGFKIGVTNNHM